MGWAAIAYRRRKGQVGLPGAAALQHADRDLLHDRAADPRIGFFAFTARDQTILETQTEDPDVSIVAIGKQWAWDFQYNGEDEDGSDAVWSMGVQAQPDANGDVDQEQLPTLYLPVDKTVKIQLQSRDVIHSFWVIDFLYKKDMYIGRDNYWSFTPTREGTYAGKCAELCGEYHSAMLFNVKVVSEAEYEDYLASLRARRPDRRHQRRVRPPAEPARHGHRATEGRRVIMATTLPLQETTPGRPTTLPPARPHC